MKSVRLSDSEVDSRFSDKKIIRIGNYVGAHIEISVSCSVCGHLWYVKPLNVFNGHGCPSCKGNVKSTNEILDAYLKNRTIKRIGNYINNQTKILFSCSVCENVWESRPKDIKKGQGCPKCAGKIRLSTDTVVSRLSVKNIKLVSGHNPVMEKTELSCGVCNKKWFATLNSIFCGQGCPRCRNSKGEKEIDRVLESMMVSFEHQKKFDDCRHIRPLSFDFYLPEHNTCIEFDGKQHFVSHPRWGGDEAFMNNVFRDVLKNNYCKSKGIRLLRIPYTQINNIESLITEFLRDK